MLKHCSPSAVDIRRRSRRNLLSNVNEEVGSTAIPSSQNEDTVSLHSCSTCSSGSQPKSEITLNFQPALIEEEAPSIEHSNLKDSIMQQQRDQCQQLVKDNEQQRLKDASTSPRYSFRRRRVPLSVIARQKSASSVSSNDNNCHLSAAGQQSETALNAKIPIKVYAKCLRSDIEYKTLSVNPQTTSRDLIWMLLSKYKMRHRDQKLFYLTMDINIKRTGIPLKRSLSLDDDSRPVELKSCHPWGECKFTLQMRKGGVVRIYDSILMAESKYKCLLISEHTTAEEVVRILFHCYGLERREKPGQFCIVEHSPQDSIERRLSMDEKPVVVQSNWPNPSTNRFILRLAKELNKMATDPKKVVEEEDGESGGCVSSELDTSYSSSGESTASSSEFSALRFRDSPVSASSR